MYDTGDNQIVFAIESQLERESWAANEPKGVTATSLIQGKKFGQLANLPSSDKFDIHICCFGQGINHLFENSEDLPDVDQHLATCNQMWRVLVSVLFVENA
jgi:hypothetical protein